MISFGKGDVLRMSRFMHVEPEAEFTLKAKKGRVAVFLLLGEEAKDGSDPLDLEARLNEFGWVRAALAPEQDK
jgi:hypothetical protein